MTSQDDHLLVGAYALGALEPSELERFEAHLAGCGSCRDETAELVETASLLAAASTEPVDPHLLAQVLSRVRSTPQLPPDGRRGPEPARPPGPSDRGGSQAGSRAHRRKPGRWLTAVAAAAAVALIAGTIATVRREQARRAELAAIIGDPGGRHYTLAGEGPGQVLVHLPAGAGRAAVEARHLPTPGGTKTYELWFVAGGTAHAAVTFRPDASGAAQVAFTPPAVDADGFGVTVEPVGGSEVPTPPIMLEASA